MLALDLEALGSLPWQLSILSPAAVRYLHRRLPAPNFYYSEADTIIFGALQFPSHESERRDHDAPIIWFSQSSFLRCSAVLTNQWKSSRRPAHAARLGYSVTAHCITRLSSVRPDLIIHSMKLVPRSSASEWSWPIGRDEELELIAASAPSPARC